LQRKRRQQRSRSGKSENKKGTARGEGTVLHEVNGADRMKKLKRGNRLLGLCSLFESRHLRRTGVLKHKDVTRRFACIIVSLYCTGFARSSHLA
jgi:hypothetical protein